MKIFKKAFTLAEVLIVIGIVGIVAVITIPTVVKNYQKKITAVKLKMAFTQITQAVKLAEAINGDISNWDFNQSHKNFFDQYLLKHIKIVEETQLNRLAKYKNISGIEQTVMMIAQQPIIIYTTVNGTDFIMLRQYIPTNYVAIYIDINGNKNKPNQLGKDTFFIVIDPSQNRPHVYFHGAYSCSNEEFSFESEPNNDRQVLLGNKNPKTAKYGNIYPCNKNNKFGTWCGRLIEVDGWKISDDYPW